ncbi:MAG: glycosyltransferase family 4 protein [Hyphomicrobiales bacterium]
MTSHSFFALAAVVLAAFALTAAATRAVLALLLHHEVLDRPNERSHHEVPTPRGGGWGVLAGLLPVLFAAAWFAGDLPRAALVLPGVILLVAVSWADDLRNLGAGVRFACQITAIAIVLVAGDLPPAFGGVLPLWLDRLLAGIAWLWFINLYNFMDGIDGITGTESAAIGLGLVAVVLVSGLGDVPLGLYGAALAGAGLGFLVWNWSPARLFMGDVGSVPLGFLIGWLLILLAGEGHLAAALILPLYYVVDASYTLMRRLMRGERIWQAHRQHAYQRAAAVIGHPATVRLIAFLNFGLIGLAVASDETPFTSLVVALAVVSAFIYVIFARIVGRSG